MSRASWTLSVAVAALVACGPAEPAEFEGDDAGECSDGADNDRDGAFDCADSDCYASPVCADPPDGGPFDAGARDSGTGMDDGGDVDGASELDGGVDGDVLDGDVDVDGGVGPDATVGIDDGGAAPDGGGDAGWDAGAPIDSGPPSTPVAYRIVTLTGEDPHVSAVTLLCQDLTSVANDLIQPDQHLIVFPSYVPGVTSQPMQMIVRPVCSAAGCTVDLGSVVADDTATFSSSVGEVCLAPIAGTTDPSYVANRPVDPCFSGGGLRFDLQTSQDDIPLHDARVSAQLVEGSPDGLIEGLIYGFIWEGEAMTVDFTLGGVHRTLWDLLPGGGACMGGDQRETYMSMSGWWLYFHFTAQAVPWMP